MRAWMIMAWMVWVLPAWADVSLKIADATIARIPLDVSITGETSACERGLKELDHALELVAIFEKRLGSQAAKLLIAIAGNQWTLEFYAQGKSKASVKQLCTKTSAVEFVEKMYEVTAGISKFFHTKVAFVADTGSASSAPKRLYWMNLNSSQVEPLAPDKPFVLFPRFSASGRYLSFISFESHGSRGIRHELYVLDLKTRRAKMVYGKWGESLGSAVFLPTDDNQLIVGLRRGKQRGFYRVDQRHPNEAEPLKYDFGFDVEPTVSPDGNTLAFSSLRTGKPMLFTMSLSTTVKQKPNRLTYVGRYNSSPAFSSDGQWIVFAAFHRDDFDLFKINPAGNLIFKLSELQHDEEAPSFSPSNAKHIVFARNSTLTTGKSTLHMMHIDFPGVDVELSVPLSNVKVKVPDWSPVLAYANFNFDK